MDRFGHTYTLDVSKDFQNLKIGEKVALEILRALF